MFALIQFRIFCLLISFPNKFKEQYFHLTYTGVKLGLSH